MTDQYWAAQQGDLVRVQELVTRQNVDERGEYGWTVLPRACVGGHVHIAACLVGLGANVNVRDNGGWTPLHWAASRSYPRCVKLLLEAGADPGIVNFFGCLPLHFAHGLAECSALLIAAHPAGVNAADKYGRIPLHNAAEYGTSDVCSLLLNAGCIVDAVNKDGHTPLYCALCLGKRDVAELLLDHGARLEHVKFDERLESIPDWAVSFVARRQACCSASYAILELARRHSGVIGGNRRDALGLVARAVWKLRQDELWEM